MLYDKEFLLKLDKQKNKTIYGIENCTALKIVDDNILVIKSKKEAADKKRELTSENSIQSLN